MIYKTRHDTTHRLHNPNDTNECENQVHDERGIIATDHMMIAAGSRLQERNHGSHDGALAVLLWAPAGPRLRRPEVWWARWARRARRAWWAMMLAFILVVRALALAGRRRRRRFYRWLWRFFRWRLAAVARRLSWWAWPALACKRVRYRVWIRHHLAFRFGRRRRRWRWGWWRPLVDDGYLLNHLVGLA